ncbi:hypothetical protein K9N68_01925 [Kovacikia minuta CCNUW1]|nr:hypothetical protein K9N68_01925 [Kovacikia minuta CCNUW1]
MGKVNINDDDGLEKEAGDMGAKAIHSPTLAREHKSILITRQPSSAILPVQCMWETLGTAHEKVWDKTIQGMNWFADMDGKMWYEPTDDLKREPDKYARIAATAGWGNRRTWKEWFAIGDVISDGTIREAIEDISDPQAEKAVAEAEGGWTAWTPYIEKTVSETRKKDRAADVKKAPDVDVGAWNWKPDTPPEVIEYAKHYIDNIHVLTKPEFNARLLQMAEALAQLGRYTCIVSEPGKSNFWVTARVLKLVKAIGGTAPEKVYSIRAQQHHAFDRQEFSIGEDPGTIVFLDDGTYSGSQLNTLINKVTGYKPGTRRMIGLIAMSAKAWKLVNLGTRRKGEAPVEEIPGTYPIEMAEHESLDAVYDALGLKKGVMVSGGDLPEPSGDASLIFYYKIADEKSVRTRLLTGEGRHIPSQPYIGYKHESSIEEGTEPYKFKGMEKKPGTYGIPEPELLEPKGHPKGYPSYSSGGTISHPRMGSMATSFRKEMASKAFMREPKPEEPKAKQPVAKLSEISKSVFDDDIPTSMSDDDKKRLFKK